MERTAPAIASAGAAAAFGMPCTARPVQNPGTVGHGGTRSAEHPCAVGSLDFFIVTRMSTFHVHHITTRLLKLFDADCSQIPVVSQGTCSTGLAARVGARVLKPMGRTCSIRRHHRLSLGQLARTEGGGDAVLLQRPGWPHDDRLRGGAEAGPQLRRRLPQALRCARRLVVPPDAAHRARVVALQHRLRGADMACQLASAPQLYLFGQVSMDSNAASRL